ncbi:sulfatase-like hydrolase/transferase [Enteractinococcus helveticum]|uniref:Arylsulfatase n=1 Tax=Enteractinococcus helveticum TaxID=1837282 RepID=A0A1B7LVB1_9MICC|nr:sulfatase-like hydrolase/transferase [Enteractinococcus helveticum]OAV52029.1 arylsulfatase [Enteractinococcus helveticum]
MHTTAMNRPVRSGKAGVALGTSLLLTAALSGCGSVAGEASLSHESSEQPNILMILLDDLGYTDLGAYGGEIETPNLDALVRESTQFTDFHAYPLCAPSRAALMTGQDPHQVGLGSMENLTPPGVPQSTPGYKGSLEGDFTGIAELLDEVGYDTYQVGKWHLGEEEGQTPQDTGFNENLTLYDAGASYFPDGLRLSQRTHEPENTVIYERNGSTLDSLPDDFFATRSYTDEMIEMIDQSVTAENPFFGYLAYTAPHDPLHVEDEELIGRYLDIYLDNYSFEELRDARIQQMLELELIEEAPSTRWIAQTPELDSITENQKKDLAYRMAVYAAVIHEADEQIGRLIDYLQDTDVYDDTLIVVASDNGAAANTHELYIRPGTERWHSKFYPKVGDIESYGLEGSFVSIGLPNAQVSSGPYFHAKNTLFEGGSRVPAFIKTPATNEEYEHRVVDTFAHITDLYPTFAEYGGANTKPGENLLGYSAKSFLEGTSDSIGDDEFGWEHFGHRSYRSGNWKLIFAPEPMGGTGEYSLYNLDKDPGETNNVIDSYPDIAHELAEKWDQYAEDQGVEVVDFEAVNAAAPESAAISLSIDWANDIEKPEKEDNNG